jgi:hypothetical protein
MLSEETLERYRKMSISERLDLTMQMMRHDWPYLLAGPEDVVKRKFELINRENDARNRNILDTLARTRDAK